MAALQKYDAIIIGSGQGGNPLAHTLADRGWRVALIERRFLGGSCINYGCTPTKTMIASAKVAQTARRAARFGVRVGPVEVNLAEVIQRKNEIVLGWRAGQQKQIDSRPTLDLYRGEGSFISQNSVAVNEARLQAGHIFINTGSSPRIPELPGISTIPYYTNLNIMDLAQLPAHLLILGGNYLGLEFGQMFRRFGSKVTILEHNSQIIPHEDPEIATALQTALENEGISFHLQANAVNVLQEGDRVHLHVKGRDGQEMTLSGSHLLVAVGRVPNTPALNLEAADVAIDKDGYVEVNERLETTAPGIWALGDVKGGPAFTHVSYDDHLIILDNLLHGGERTTKGRIIPYTLFTDPELGRAGLSESRARDAGYRLKVGTVQMSSVARAIESGKTDGLMKIVVNAENDQILGASILGEAGGELVQHLTTVMRAQLPYTILKKAMYVHPTLTEGFFSLMDSVKVVDQEGD